MFYIALSVNFEKVIPSDQPIIFMMTWRSVAAGKQKHELYFEGGG